MEGTKSNQIIKIRKEEQVTLSS